jgi:hypothetical protein
MTLPVPLRNRLSVAQTRPRSLSGHQQAPAAICSGWRIDQREAADLKVDEGYPEIKASCVMCSTHEHATKLTFNVR